jgi:hypothetical protein
MLLVDANHKVRKFEEIRTGDIIFPLESGWNCLKSWYL